MNSVVMFWMIFIGVCLFIIGWLLLAPIYLIVILNDKQQQLEIKGWWLFYASLRSLGQEWRLQLKFLFFKWEWPITQLIKRSAKSPKAKSKKLKSWRPKHPFRTAKRLLKSFHLLFFRFHLDTDDYVWNAYLFPIFQLVKTKKSMDWQINFQGRTDVQLIVENKLVRILYAFFA